MICRDGHSAKEQELHNVFYSKEDRVPCKLKKMDLISAQSVTGTSWNKYRRDFELLVKISIPDL